MFEVQQTAEFEAWLDGLKDRRAQATIAVRLARLAQGLVGDVKPVGQGVSELRVPTGPGYRVYFVQRGQVLIVVLCGGDKSTQPKDIEKAKAIAKGL